MFLMGADGMEVRYILQALHYMSADQSLSLSNLKKYVPGIQASAKRTSLSYASRGPVILILDKVCFVLLLYAIVFTMILLKILVLIFTR